MDDATEREIILNKQGKFKREGSASASSSSDSDSSDDENPEDTIPDLPENIAAREFLKNAPTKGLWLPLGKEVKVMQWYFRF